MHYHRVEPGNGIAQTALELVADGVRFFKRHASFQQAVQRKAPMVAHRICLDVVACYAHALGQAAAILMMDSADTQV